MDRGFRRDRRAVAVVGLLSALGIWAAGPAGAQAETLTLPAGAAAGLHLSDPIYQVSCPAAGDCVAVGAYVDAGGATQALIESQADGSWSPGNVPDDSLPNAGALPHPYLTAVNCTSVGNCVAVDAYDDSQGYEQGLIDTESDGLWTPIAAPLAGLHAAVNPGVEVYDIACPAASGCVAVGDYVSTDTYFHALIETQSADGSWIPTEAPAPPQSNKYSEPTFYAISCASVGNCAAVGYYTDSSGDTQGLLETDQDGTWSAGEVDLSGLSRGGDPPDADPQATLYSVSCPSAGNCTAVGTYEDAAGSYEGLTVSEVDGVWQPAATVPLPADASTLPVGGGPPQSDLYLNAVSCASAGDCTAVGSYDATSDNDVAGLWLTETDGVWTAASPVSLPTDAAQNPEVTLDSVFCQAASDCIGVGTYVDSAGGNVALVARQSPTGWTTAGVDLASAYDANLPTDYWASVSCAADGYCAAGGYAAAAASGLDQAFLIDAPSAPSVPVASLTPGQGGTEATVSWSPPADDGGLPVTGYVVTADDLTALADGDQPSPVESVTLSPDTTETSFSGLTPGDSYTFTVTASSLLGVGLPATSASLSVPGGVTWTTNTMSLPTGNTTNPPITGTSTASSTTTTTSHPTTTSTTTTSPSTTNPSRTTTSDASAIGGDPSPAQIRASLADIERPGRAERATRLLGAHGYELRYVALDAGRVSVGWYLPNARDRSSRGSLIARGASTARGPGVVVFDLRLTAAGRRLLRSGRVVRLTALAEFVSGDLKVSRTSHFTLDGQVGAVDGDAHLDP